MQSPKLVHDTKRKTSNANSQRAAAKDDVWKKVSFRNHVRKECMSHHL